MIQPRHQSKASELQVGIEGCAHREYWPLHGEFPPPQRRNPWLGFEKQERLLFYFAAMPETNQKLRLHMHCYIRMSALMMVLEVS